MGTADKARHDISQNERLAQAFKQEGHNAGQHKDQCKVAYDVGQMVHCQGFLSGVY